MENGLEIYNLLIDLREWIAQRKPKSEEARLTEKLDRLIFEMGRRPAYEQPDLAEDGIASANQTFGKFLEKADPSAI